MKWHPETLTPLTGKVAEILKRSQAPAGFYLVGGTGLALMLGHRYSEDLDFFTPSNLLEAREREALLEMLRPVLKVEIQRQNGGWLHLFLNGLSVTFLRYPYPLLKGLLNWNGIAVAHPDDIALMKISAIIGRGTKKDFLDLYALCQERDLAEYLALAKRKFPEHRNFLTQASYALAYFQDAEKERMPRLIQKYDWDTIRSFFEREAPRAFRKLLTRG